MDIKKSAKQILKLLKKIDEETQKGRGTIFDEENQGYLKECAEIIKNIILKFIEANKT